VLVEKLAITVSGAKYCCGVSSLLDEVSCIEGVDCINLPAANCCFAFSEGRLKMEPSRRAET